MNKKVLAIIGARPQFIKHFPFEFAAKQRLDLITLHTGQHYDANMSQVFFDQLGMSKPDYKLNIGSGKHGEQTAKMMIEIEKVCFDIEPDAVMVYGDTNSTLAAAVVTSKLHIPLFHIEAGLRSYNKEMPEEVNRIMTDHVSALLFVPSKASLDNLKKEGIVGGVHVVGDIMKDIVLYVKRNKLAVHPKEDYPFYYATLHRPYNVDVKERLIEILQKLEELDDAVIFSIHPRTRNKMAAFGLKESNYKNIKFIDPQGYLENMGYLTSCKGLITDSGGMQKEAYWLEKKCLTIRSETEWIETLKDAANELVFDDLEQMKTSLKTRSPRWDSSLYGQGEAAHLMVDEMIKFLEQ